MSRPKIVRQRMLVPYYAFAPIKSSPDADAHFYRYSIRRHRHPIFERFIKHDFTILRAQYRVRIIFWAQ